VISTSCTPFDWRQRNESVHLYQFQRRRDRDGALASALPAVRSASSGPMECLRAIQPPIALLLFASYGADSPRRPMAKTHICALYS
jgi:hypothetical protein